VTALNWVDFTVESEFAAGIERLIGAIDTDLAFVKEHTRLLVRARMGSRGQRPQPHASGTRSAKRDRVAGAVGGRRQPRGIAAAR
jgi:hypothetical protein